MLAHVSSGKTLSIEDLAQLESYETWLEERLTAPEESNSAAASAS
jgi:hypothetical protein